MNRAAAVRRSWVVFLLAMLCALGPAWAAEEPQQRPTDRIVAQAPGPRQEALARRLTEQIGGRVLWNRHTGLPARIVTQRPFTKAVTAGSADAEFRGFVDANRDLLGVAPADLQLVAVQSRNGRHYLKYRQMVGGVPVEGLEAGCIIGEDGLLVSYAADVVKGLAAPPEAAVTPEAAVEKARAALEKAGDGATLSSVEKILVPRVPVPEPETAGEYNLVYRVQFRTAERDRNPHRLVVVDAATGRVIEQYDATPWDITGTVQGEVSPDLSSDPTQTRAFEHVSVTAIALSPPMPGLPLVVSTNGAGHYTIPSWAGNWHLIASTSGAFAQVTSVSQTAVVHTQPVANGSVHNWTWNAAGGNDVDQLTVFYHINRLHDELYQNLIGYAWTNSWTGTAQFRAETGYTFNNSFAGNPMTFGTAAFVRDAAAIYHECTHNVLYSLFGGWVGFGNATQNQLEGYAFDEGFADFFAGVQLGRPNLIGRNLSNTMSYPANYNTTTASGLEGHSGGQIIAGAAWDLRVLMQERYGTNQGARKNANLVFDGLQRMATYPRPYRFSKPGTSNFLDALLEADDDNANLADGTPHDREILQAFRNHAMLPVDVWMADRVGDPGNVPSNPNGEPWWLSPDIIVESKEIANVAGTLSVPGKTTTLNRVRVRVRNQGYLASGSVQVVIKTRSLLKGTPWTTLGTVTVADVPAGGDVLSPETTWQASPFDTVRAELITSKDPITEAGDVRLDNNLAQRNLLALIVWAGAKVKVAQPWLFLDELQADRPPGAKARIDIVRERAAANLGIGLDLPELREQGKLKGELRPTVGETRMVQTVLVQEAEQPVPAKPPSGTEARVEGAFKDLEKALAARPETTSPQNPVLVRQPVVRIVQARVDAYPDLPIDLDRATPVVLTFTIGADARVGDVYIVHVMQSIGGPIVRGMTYELRVGERTPENAALLEATLRVP